MVGGYPVWVSGLEPHSVNGTIYYYVTNLQGDVVAILDSSGNEVVEYTYDAWGKLLTTTGTLADTLGQHNPLRYRGYVYDPETALYYLQSRYYDPQLGRFINADAFVSTGQGLLGYNMFSYCNNNPVMYADSTGLALVPCTVAINDGGKGIVEPDPLTVSMGVAGSVTLGPFVYGAQLALVTDSYGYSEVQVTFYSPISSDAIRKVPSVDEMFSKVASYEKITDILEFSLMGNLSIYNAPAVENLYNTGYQVGGALGAGGAIAVDYNIVPNGPGSPYKGITFSAGLGSNDIHASMGSTFRLMSSKASVYDLVDAIRRGLYGGY